MEILKALAIMTEHWRAYGPAREARTHWGPTRARGCQLMGVVAYREDMLSLATDIHPDGAPADELNRAAEAIVGCAKAGGLPWTEATRAAWYGMALWEPWDTSMPLIPNEARREYELDHSEGT